MHPPKDPSVPNTLQKRPTTPGKSSSHLPHTESTVISKKEQKEKDKDKEPRRSSLSFLRRSKSGDPVRSSLRPLVPNIPQQPPRIPELWAANGSPPRPENTSTRDSVDIVSGSLGIPGMSPGRKSTDTGVSGVSSAPGGYYVPVKSSGRDSVPESTKTGGSMAHRGRYSYASSAVTAVNSPRRVRRRKDPTPFK